MSRILVWKINLAQGCSLEVAFSFYYSFKLMLFFFRFYPSIFSLLEFKLFVFFYIFFLHPLFFYLAGLSGVFLYFCSLLDIFSQNIFS
jgi:hypothetical protein